MSQHQPVPHKRIAHVAAALFCRWGVAAVLLLSSVGCNSFGSGRVVKELQSENERLLSEYRAQRDRLSELETANRQQAERLAESEKLLARLTQGSGAGRLSSLPSGFQPTAKPSASASEGSSRTNPSGQPAAGGAASELRWHPRVGAP